MKNFLLISIFCSPFLLVAQGDEEVATPFVNNYDSVRSVYIKSYPDHFFLWPVMKQRRLDFTITDLPDRDKKVAYRSNTPYAFGLGMYLFEVRLEVAVAVPLGQRSKEIYGDSDTRDLQLNLFSKKGGFEFHYQKYSGFYIDDPSVLILPDMPYPQRPDIETRNVGFVGNYIFNNKKFSLRSSYIFMDRQLRSAGSFGLFTAINSFKTVGDSAILGERYKDDFGVDTKIKEIKTTTLGIGPGYSYNLIHEGFFANATLSVGPAHNWLSYRSENGSKKEDSKLTVFFAARAALGYNGDRFFTGLSYTTQGSNARFDTIQLASSRGVFKILFGLRFREVGFLKKKIGDLPKALGL